MMYKSKTGKNWVEMDNKELRQEIAHLILQLDKVTAKNKRRRSALKTLNTGILVKHKFLNDQAERVKYLEGALDTWKRRAHRLEMELGDVVNRIVHDGVKITMYKAGEKLAEGQAVYEKRGWLSTLLGRKGRVHGVTGA